MSHSIEVTNRAHVNEHANFDYNTANKLTKDESSEYEKLNKSAGN